RDRLFRILARLVRSDWRRHLLLVRPETVVGWHRRGWEALLAVEVVRSVGRPRLRPGNSSRAWRPRTPGGAASGSAGDRRSWASWSASAPHSTTGGGDRPGRRARAGGPSCATTDRRSGRRTS